MFIETTEGNKHQEQKQVTETRKEELNKWIQGQKSHSLIIAYISHDKSLEEAWKSGNISQHNEVII